MKKEPTAEEDNNALQDTQESTAQNHPLCCENCTECSQEKYPQKPIELFPGVEILPNLAKRHAIQYLQRFCAVDELGDAIFIKKLGNDSTTYSIDWEEPNEISEIKKIRDSYGCRMQEILYDMQDEYEEEYGDEEEFL